MLADVGVPWTASVSTQRLGLGGKTIATLVRTMSLQMCNYREYRYCHMRLTGREMDCMTRCKPGRRSMTQLRRSGLPPYIQYISGPTRRMRQHLYSRQVHICNDMVLTNFTVVFPPSQRICVLTDEIHGTPTSAHMAIGTSVDCKHGTPPPHTFGVLPSPTFLRVETRHFPKIATRSSSFATLDADFSFARTTCNDTLTQRIPPSCVSILLTIPFLSFQVLDDSSDMLRALLGRVGRDGHKKPRDKLFNTVIAVKNKTWGQPKPIRISAWRP